MVILLTSRSKDESLLIERELTRMKPGGGFSLVLGYSEGSRPEVEGAGFRSVKMLPLEEGFTELEFLRAALPVADKTEVMSYEPAEFPILFCPSRSLGCYELRTLLDMREGFFTGGLRGVIYGECELGLVESILFPTRFVASSVLFPYMKPEDDWLFLMRHEFAALFRKGVLEKPVVEKPVLEKPVLEKPVVEKPVVEKPVVEKKRNPAKRSV